MNLKKTPYTSILLISLLLVISGIIQASSGLSENETVAPSSPPQNVNMFVTHGHCSTPFSGKISDFKIDLAKRDDQGNPLEGMKLSFSVDPNSFMVCSGKELTQKIKTPGLFINEKGDFLTFRTTEIYTMGIDWYQVNGKLAIKGVERNVKLMVTGIRKPMTTTTQSIVIEGRMDLSDWGIDYDKIVNGRSNETPTKWMYLNMHVSL